MNLSLNSVQKKSPGEQSRRLTNLLALDFGASGIKAVRVKKTKDEIQLVAADILPATDVQHPGRPTIPKGLSAYYASLCASADDVMLRVFSHVLKEDESAEDAARESMSVPSGHRVGVKVIDRQAGRRESTILGTAISNDVVQHYLELFANGAPALHSMELSGLAAFSAYWMAGRRPPQDQAVCLIEAGAHYTCIGFFHRNRPLLVNRFSLGSETISRQIQQDLGVDADMARTVLAGGSVDISGSIQAALGPFLKQLSIYREFIERQHKARLTSVCLSGGMASSPDWKGAISGLLSLEPIVWNPFDRVIVPDDLDLEKFKGQEGRFAAAIGAALAGLESGS